jgi:ABC-type branched-subunit amino acid transport system ATPase component
MNALRGRSGDPNAPLLEVEHLTMRFGGLVAIDDVSFDAADQQITAIIGPNGAGKTTVFNCLTGFYKPTVGRLSLNHPRGGPFLLERMEGYQIPQKAGVARTFQNIRLFAQMSVLENLIVAQHNKRFRLDRRHLCLACRPHPGTDRPALHPGGWPFPEHPRRASAGG